MTPLDQHHLQSWYALRGRGGDPVRTLNRFRQRHPSVFIHICQTDTEAAGIAVQHGWAWAVGDETHGERSPEEMQHARQTVTTALTAIAAAKLPRS